MQRFSVYHTHFCKNMLFLKYFFFCIKCYFKKNCFPHIFHKLCKKPQNDSFTFTFYLTYSRLLQTTFLYIWSLSHTTGSWRTASMLGISKQTPNICVVWKFATFFEKGNKIALVPLLLVPTMNEVTATCLMVE